MNPADSHQTTQPPGLLIATKLILILLSFITITALIMSMIYQHYTHDLIMKQINLRTYSISHSLSDAVLEPLIERNYLRINKITRGFSKLPGVAYVVVSNDKGHAISSVLGDESRFDANFIAQVRNQGFTGEQIQKNPLAKDEKQAEYNLILGGQDIYEVALKVGDLAAKARVGLFIQDIKESADAVLKPIVITFAIILLLGGVVAWWVGQSIAQPIRLLAKEAEKISMGQRGEFGQIKTSGEVWQLSHAFSRMQHSVEKLLDMIEKTKKNQA
jgi:sensor histidine kinase regulating citrate/malate metabolism